MSDTTFVKKSLKGEILLGSIRDKETLTDKEVMQVLRYADDTFAEHRQVLLHHLNLIYDLKDQHPTRDTLRLFFFLTAVSWFLSLIAVCKVTIQQYSTRLEVPQQQQELPEAELPASFRTRGDFDGHSAHSARLLESAGDNSLSIRSHDGISDKRRLQRCNLDGLLLLPVSVPGTAYSENSFLGR